MIIDSHCHLHDEKFTQDLEEVLLRSKRAGISHLVTIGCDISTTTAARDLANKFDNIYFSAGFHPHEAKHLTQENLSALSKLAQEKKCIAIGECGLDYYYNHSNMAEQHDAFIKQINLSKELNLPLIVHLRDAHNDCINIFKNHLDNNQKVVIHCFSGTLDEAKEFAALGCYISISGIITFKKPGALPDVARELAIEKILVETDCPYLAPHPFRGKRNEPSFITNTLAAVAKTRGEDIDKAASAIHSNTMFFFGLSDGN